MGCCGKRNKRAKELAGQKKTNTAIRQGRVRLKSRKYKTRLR